MQFPLFELGDKRFVTPLGSPKTLPVQQDVADLTDYPLFMAPDKSLDKMAVAGD